MKGEAGYSQSVADFRSAMSGFVGPEGVGELPCLVDARDEARECERDEERWEVVVGDEGLEW